MREHRASRVTEFEYDYIFIIFTQNLGSEIAIPGREREQGRFRGSTEGAKGRIERVRGSREGARESTGGAEREHGAVQGRSRWESQMDFLHLGLSCCLYFTAPYRILLKNDLKTVLEVGPNQGHFQYI